MDEEELGKYIKTCIRSIMSGVDDVNNVMLLKKIEAKAYYPLEVEFDIAMGLVNLKFTVTINQAL